MQENLLKRHEAIRAATHPLPGSTPYENRRPLNIPAEFEGRTLLDFLCEIFPHIAREEWLHRCGKKRFINSEGVVIDADYLLKAGERCVQIIPGTTEPPVNPDIRIVHEDEVLFVVHKPAPLPMHPSGRFNRNTLQHILCEVYAPQRPKFVHRLDANTTGIVLCARTRHFANLLQQQFLQGRVEKVYLVRVQGHPESDTFTCDAPISPEPGGLGTHGIDEEDGQHALTEFVVQQRFEDGTTLLSARPITGRTNQIRVHLWHLGLPVCGDPAYLPGQKLGDTQTLSPECPPLQLHAWRLAFDHPITKTRMIFETERPSWA